MHTPLKMVFFDAVGTLICLPRPVGEHYRQIALRYGADLPAESLEQAFHASWKSAPARQNIATGPRQDDDKGWWRALVHRVLDKTLPDSQRQGFSHHEYFEELYAHFAQPGVWTIFPEVPDVLTELQARALKIGIISNFDRRLYKVLEHLRLADFFTSIVISSEVGADKPDPAIFQRALASNHLQPGEAVHVGDDPKRDWRAGAIGLGVFELDRPRNTLRELIPWVDSRLTQAEQTCIAE